MRTVNRMFLIGRLGHDPELRMSKSGKPCCSFTLATNRSRKEPDGSYSEETDWHAIRVWGDRAEQCMRFLRRGSMVNVEGTLVYDKWTDDEGKRRSTPRIWADRITFLHDLRAPGDLPIAVELEEPSAVAAEA